MIERLQEGFSPELISLRLKCFSHIENIRYINPESLYQWLYNPTQKKQKLYKYLPQHHGARGRRKRVGIIQNRISIHERPETVNNRDSIGHWEADLLSFLQNRQHALVIHERKTRYTALIKLTSKKAEETFKALLIFFESLPAHLRKSVTFDNGMEFSLHDLLKAKLGIKTYFCDVYASWQKGGIENMNGRLRRDLPRKTDIANISDADLEQILLTHNLMPRKVLNGYSPIESLANHLGKSIVFSFNHSVALRY